MTDKAQKYVDEVWIWISAFNIDYRYHAQMEPVLDDEMNLTGYKLVIKECNPERCISRIVPLTIVKSCNLNVLVETFRKMEKEMKQ